MHMYRRDRYKLIIIIHIKVSAVLSSPPLVGQPLYYRIDYPTVMYSACGRGNCLNALPDFALVIEGVHR